MGSPKHNFLRQVDDEDSQDFWDNVIRIDRDEYRPTAVSTRVHRSLKRKRLLVGGLGSSKTRTAAEHINQMALTYPGSQYVIARKDLGDLRRTTQLEFLEKVVEPKTIDRFLINENTLHYTNSSKIFFMECKTVSNFKSLEICGYLLDEADENEEGQGKDRLLTVLDSRCRQKIKMNGIYVPVPYCGLIVYNPTTDDHWLAKLEDRPEPNMEVFRSSTFDNEANLPPDYIPNLLASLAPWEIRSLVYGERASRPKGNPVIHGFGDDNIYPLRIRHHLPLRRTWDFGFGKPCVAIAQYDPEYKRYLKLREIQGNNEQLKFFAPKVIAATRALVGPGFTIFDSCDPHGKDQRDVGEGSVEYLRIHHEIFCNFQRQTIKKGLDEIQELVLSLAPYKEVDHDPESKEALEERPRFLVDPSCKITIAAYLGGYYRDDEGNPFKDNVHDHVVDTDRYGIVATMGDGLRNRFKNKKRFIPRCAITGY